MLSYQAPVQQQSTQMMQTTRSGRPFVKDIHDLFSTLIISLPMETHRNLFKSYANSFTTEETIANLGSLKFTQSNHMAKSICQTFQDARLFENLTDSNNRIFRDKGVYGLTPKGTYILERFVSRNGITAPHLAKIFSSQSIQIRLFALERDPETDSINLSKQNVESVFRRFAGPRPNFKIPNEIVSSNDQNIFSVDRNLGIEVKERYINNKWYHFTFSGANVCDWLCEFTTLISKEEAMKVATEFIRLGFLEPINSKVNDTKKSTKRRDRSLFKYSKSTYYNITEEGRQLALWDEHLPAKKDSGVYLSPQLNDGKSQRSSLIENNQVIKESNTKKLQQILDDSNLCSLFMNFLKSTLCEENLLFLLDVQKFKIRYNADVNEDGECRDPKEQFYLISDAFKIYNTYLAPASLNELNIDFNLRQSMTRYMTSIASGHNDKRPKSTASDQPPQKNPITSHLYDEIQHVIFSLVATDSIPKFIRTKEFLAYTQ
ncbi:6827_t:CDS:2 [Funneliformis caledonium]|uniref:6827_t:CDS:1 n=1 Tax=Funneliformis caledonium TaxID=1117310 RepID=A0A9N8ZM89_9GLOM|nr:6827_t:CDS:2 [Funneliformis caledonium]